jgi:hypothetical protein
MSLDRRLARLETRPAAGRPASHDQAGADAEAAFDVAGFRALWAEYEAALTPAQLADVERQLTETLAMHDRQETRR